MPRATQTTTGEPLGEYRNWDANKVQNEDAAAHRWYRFVLSFPPHLVRDYLNDFGVRNGGMARHLETLKRVLKPGAKLAYVVGDQASYLQVMIRTGRILADVAKSQGYEPVRIDLFRTRLATATKQQLREEVLILRWPGNKSSGGRTMNRLQTEGPFYGRSPAQKR